MHDYKWLNEYCLNRFGSAAALEAQLPTPASDDYLRALSADRYLSTLALRVFRAGLKHSLVDAKWPAFEQVFFGFDPEKVVLMGAEHLERLMQDTRIIRHLGKLKSVPRNAQMILDVQKQHGSFGAFIADWPVHDITGLWQYLAKHGNQMGGLSARASCAWWARTPLSPPGTWSRPSMPRTSSTRCPAANATKPWCRKYSTNGSTRAAGHCASCRQCWPTPSITEPPAPRHHFLPETTGRKTSLLMPVLQPKLTIS
ncbi:hypothetical protein PBOI14_57950 [Pseudomonas sp. Boi14]|nr:hypothetical protein PBOI14_57950 [Pseudomonas sp. Boi14]